MSTIVVCVRMFLSGAGVHEFDAVLREHRTLASKWRGFFSLRCLRPKDPPDEIHERVLLLEFQTEAQLRDWRASPEHARIAQKYQRLWQREPQVEFYIECPGKKNER